MKKGKFSIAGRPIGQGHAPYIIAEMSGNHNGELERALQLVELAKNAGADAIKLQTYTADGMTIDCDKPDFCIKGGLWDGYNLYRLYQWAHTPWEWHKPLMQKAAQIGITAFSTPFDETAVDFLEELKVPAYKIASFEIVDLPLIKKVAACAKPMIISTGMANHAEIKDAVETAHRAGCEQIILLHCVSGYPTPAEQLNLKTIAKLREDFDVEVGLSDHTLGTTAAIASVGLGSVVIEKHFTLRRSDGGPDAAFSLEPDELKSMVTEVKTAWASLGSSGYERKPVEEESVRFRRSIYVVKDVAKGESLTAENIRIIRPGFGLLPKHFDEVVGEKASCAIERGTALDWQMVEKK